MANNASAKKRIRQNATRYARNAQHRHKVQHVLKDIAKAAGSATQELVSNAQSVIAKAYKAGVLSRGQRDRHTRNAMKNSVK